MANTMSSSSYPDQKVIVRLNRRHTCIDIGLNDHLSCINCKNERDVAFAAKKYKMKREKRNFKSGACEQPWSLKFRLSRFNIKKQTYKDVWKYMIMKGYYSKEQMA